MGDTGELAIVIDQRTASIIWSVLSDNFTRHHEEFVRDARDEFFEACIDSGFDPRRFDKE